MKLLIYQACLISLIFTGIGVEARNAAGMKVVLVTAPSLPSESDQFYVVAKPAIDLQSLYVIEKLL